MSLASELDALPAEPSSPREKLLAALALYEEGLEVQRLNFSRRYPGITPERLAELMQAWLRREDVDEAG